MSEDKDDRLTSAGALWFFSTVALAALFISAAAQGELTVGHIILALVILGLAVAGTVFFLHGINSETRQTKEKRQRIDSILYNMSDEELIELKQRFSDGDFREETVLDYMGDDGELVLRS